MIRVGHGFDTHRFVTGRPCIIGGVRIEHTHGLDGHSDADVLLHAICDALLGAAGLGDIGKFFPDSDPNIEGINSRKILKKVISILKKEKFKVVNIDCTIICEQPKIEAHSEEMITNIAQDCECLKNQINIKGTTTEKLGALGRLEGIAAHAVCIVESI